MVGTHLFKHPVSLNIFIFLLFTLDFGILTFKLAQWVECSPHGPKDLGSIPGCVIPKTLKIVLDTYLPNTQHYKLHIKGKI